MDQATKVIDASPPGPPIIHVQDLGHRYGSNDVLHALNLAIPPGEFTVILGSSGCGKSTLLRLIAGLERPSTGRILIQGIDQSNVAPHRRDIAMVFQHGNGYEHLSVDENLRLASKLNRAARDVGQELNQWLDWLDIRSIKNQKLSQLSGGQSQRVAIARAFLTGRKVILMDEPLAHLDYSLRVEVRKLLARVQLATRKTVLYVTHDSEEAMSLATNMAVLGSGRILQLGRPRELFESPVSFEVAKRLGQPSIEFVDIPAVWFRKPTSLRQTTPAVASTIECGIRPSDWRIESLQTQSSQNLGELGLSNHGHEIRLRGELTGCRWLGERWELSARFPKIGTDSNPDSPTANIAISVGSSPWGRLEEILNQIVSPAFPADSTWIIEAWVPKSSIKTCEIPSHLG
jgi:ABC-type sugar transport system ATPase subunit